MYKRDRTFAGVLATTAVLATSLLGANVAQAAGQIEGGSGSQATMGVTGFDAAVAEANGFEIVTDSSGTQTSVPVTDAAKAIVAAAAQAGHRDLGTVDGDCGRSWLNTSRAGSNKVVINTGYRVWLPSVGQQWNVDLFSSHGGYSVPFSGAAFSPTWDAYETEDVGNSHGTHSNVRDGSFAELVDGELCYSGSPTAGT